MTPVRLPRLAVVVGLVLAILLTIHVLSDLASVLLLLFAGLTLAVILEALATQLQRILPGGYPVAYGATLFCVLLVLAVAGLLIGPQLADQIPQLAERIPKAWHTLLGQLHDSGVLDFIDSKGEKPLDWLTSNMPVVHLVSGTFGALVDVFVIVFVGLYAAAAPQRYLTFGRRLLGPARQRRVASLATEMGRALRHWVLGRFVTLVIVGVASGVGLWLLGVPLAFTLGLVAGLLSIVPYVGPILGLIPALLIAGVESPTLAGWVVVLFAFIHLAESSLLTPLIQQRVIAMPPAILITAQLVGGVLIGPLGVLLAAPLVVCGMVVARWLNEETE